MSGTKHMYNTILVCLQIAVIATESKQPQPNKFKSYLIYLWKHTLKTKVLKLQTCLMNNYDNFKVWEVS